MFLPLHFGERRRTVLAVQRKSGLGQARRDHSLAIRRGCCHQLILTGNRGTPRTPVRAHVPLLPSGPGGVGGVTPCRGSSASVVSRGTQMVRNPPPRGFG
jgi:hypothetical protein